MSSVQETVWNWRDSSGPGGEKSDAAALRRQAVIQAVVMGVIGFVLFQWIGHHTFAKVIWGLAAVILVLGLVAPAAYRPIHGFGQWLGKAVGALLTWVLLVPLYFLVFTPGAILLRLQGRDPMHRKMRDGKYTCWIPRNRKGTAETYSRQFLLEDKEARSVLRPVGAGKSVSGEDKS
jgi:hypothetical protein